MTEKKYTRDRFMLTVEHDGRYPVTEREDVLVSHLQNRLWSLDGVNDRTALGKLPGVTVVRFTDDKILVSRKVFAELVELAEFYKAQTKTKWWQKAFAWLSAHSPVSSPMQRPWLRK